MNPLRAKIVRWLFAVTASLGAVRPCAGATSFAAGVQTGTVQNSSITEASGFIASRMNANVFWTHNDSGDSARVFAMTSAGTNLGTYSISGASALDWEDIAIGPGPTVGMQYLYLGDIGDNFAIRPNVSVYRVPEPAVSDTQSSVTTSITGAEKFTFAYPDGPRDAESMFVDPATRDIIIISKPGTTKHVYRAPYPQSTSGTTTLELVASFSNSTALTAADISPGGDEIIIRSYATTSGLLYVRPPGGSIADAFNTAPITIPLRSEPQGEAIAFDRNGWGYYTVSEGVSQPIYYFDRVPHGDFNRNGVVDAADYAVWRKGVGTTYQAGDFDTWRANYGQTAPGAGVSVAEVPEPSGLLLFCIAGWHAFAARRRRHVRNAMLTRLRRESMPRVSLTAGWG